jgi:hypothetical protein
MYINFLKLRGRFSTLKSIFPLLSGKHGRVSGDPIPRRRSWLGALLLGITILGTAQGQSVVTYHGNAGRSGNFTMPALTWERARNIHLDPSFRPLISGHLYAQPLYWRPPGSASGQLLVATEDNNVYAIDAGSGREIWVRSLGPPVPLSTLSCGNIDPLGITGTPVIDEASQAIYVAAMVRDAAGPHHRVFALSLKEGSPLPGWPVDVAELLAVHGQRFNTRDQNQRGALAIFDGHVYVPYGGHYGDCGDYHGWVVGIGLRNPGDVVSWSTRGRGGGIWAPGGIASDGRSLFVATGNTIDVSTWSDGEAVFRLAPDLRRRDQPEDFLLQLTDARSIRATPISAAPTRSRWTCPRPTVPRRSSWHSAKTPGPTCSIATASAGSVAASPRRSSRRARSARRPRPIRLGKESTWHSKDRARAARLPAGPAH